MMAAWETWGGREEGREGRGGRRGGGRRGGGRRGGEGGGRRGGGGGEGRGRKGGQSALENEIHSTTQWTSAGSIVKLLDSIYRQMVVQWFLSVSVELQVLVEASCA